MHLRRIFLLAAGAALLSAHPMGNFSVSHYTKLTVGADRVDVTYILDLAEIPSFQLLDSWKLEAGSPRAALEAKAREQARAWSRELHFTSAGKPVPVQFDGAGLVIADGAGNVPVIKIVSRLHLAAAGKLDFEDRNYPDRAGWKEIVVAAKGAKLGEVQGAGADRSQALTAYPADPTVAPLQELRASLTWIADAPTAAPVKPEVEVAAVTPVAPAVAKPAAARGEVTRGDYLSVLLKRREIPFSMMLIGLLVAFGFGAAHAMSPGHGKTIVAAYLVGTRGTVKHALFLGAMVTFTHTVSVFLLGLGVLFLSEYIVPEKIFPVLGAISGLSIVGIGLSLLVKRWRKLRPAQPHHHHHHGPHTHEHHHHHHDHDHDNDHAHDHHHDHHHTHDHGHTHDHDHHHGPGGHSHVIEGDITLGSLIALGASGGLVPCPSALVLLLSAIAAGRVAFGLGLLVAFSLGLALVLMAIGVAVLYAKHLLPDAKKTARHPAFRLVPVLSAAVIVFLGCLMTAVSLGWVRPDRLIG